MNNLTGVVLSLVYVGLVLGSAALLSRFAGWKEEATRKFTHILLSGWWLLAMVFFSSPLWAALPPALFVLVNSWAYLRGGLPFLQRGRQDNSPGTVYYAVSLLLLALLCFGVAAPYVGALGVLSMGLGDGFAAVLGTRFGKRRFAAAGGKSLVGMAAMLLFSFLACLAVLGIFAPANSLPTALLLAALATLLEAFSSDGLDNLTVPLGVSGLYYALFYPGAQYTAPVLGALLSTVVVLVALRKGLLTRPAGLAAILVGAWLYTTGGPALWVLLIWFFTSSNLATRLLAPKARQAPGKKHTGRKLRQVLANSLPALVCATAYSAGAGPWLLLLAAGALSACTADTWASEIGVYSRNNPVNIFTLQPMQRGISGGVSPLGLAASALAAGSTALLAMLLFRLAGGIPTGPGAFLLVAGCGMAGSLADSALGALLQAKYQLPGKPTLYEAKPLQEDGTLVAGVGWMTNDMVNLLSGTLVVLLALPLTLLA